MVIEGKTVEKTGAYTLHIPTNSVAHNFIGVPIGIREISVLPIVGTHGKSTASTVYRTSREIDTQGSPSAAFGHGSSCVPLWRSFAHGPERLLVGDDPFVQSARQRRAIRLEILKRYLAQDLFNGNNAATIGRDDCLPRNSSAGSRPGKTDVMLRNILGGVFPSSSAAVATADDLEKYPIHLKHSSRLDWDEAEKVIVGEWKASWDRARKCLTDVELLSRFSPPTCKPANLAQLL